VSYDRLWLVTNGKGLIKEYLENDSEPWSWEYEEDLPDLKRTLKRISRFGELDLAVSTDRWHEDESRYTPHERGDRIQDYLSDLEGVNVTKHGPTDYNNLISMGKGYGTDLRLYSLEDSPLIYVNIHGDIFPSCDLSYTFMHENKDTGICFGNVLTSSYEEVQRKIEYYNHIATLGELYLTENYQNFTELEEEHGTNYQQYYAEAFQEAV
jgi:hypothetical protein